MEHGNFAIELRGDKVVLCRKKEGDHFTLQFGSKSGIIDLHRTWTNAAGREQRETVFAMHRDRIPAAMEQLIPFVLSLTESLRPRPLRVGWLGHRRIGFAVLSIDEEKINRLRSGRRRLLINEANSREAIFAPDFLSDIWHLPGTFLLIRRQRIIGFGAKVPYPDGAKLYWVKSRDLMRLSKKMSEATLEALSRHKIPAEEYENYDVLRQSGRLLFDNSAIL